MISIIICSVNEFFCTQLEKNIDKTIGDVVYEIIKIENSINSIPITQVYNLGISKSKGDYLLFIHEDILFHTKYWGRKLIEIFENNLDYGMISIAGASVKTKIPSGWWDCEERYKALNIIQHLPNNKVVNQNFGFEKGDLQEVVVVDGVFMAVRKKTNVFFDELLDGFHCYDLNISFEIQKKGYKIGVTNQILIEHFSLGSLSLNWLTSTIKFHKKNQELLPLKVESINNNINEALSCERLVYQCFNKGQKKLFFKYWLKLFLLKPISLIHLILMKNIFTKVIR